MRQKYSLLDFLSCLGMANLIMMKVWLELLPFSNGTSFWLNHSLFNSYLGAIINTIVVGLIIWCAVIAFRYFKVDEAVFAPIIYGITSIFFLNGVRIGYALGFHTLVDIFGKDAAIFVGLVVLLLLGYGLFWLVSHRHVIVGKSLRIPLLIVPFAIMTIGQSIFALWQVQPESAFQIRDRVKNQVQKKKAAIPVVWIIFDELDYGLAFGRRPKDLLLPAFDSLLETSLSATFAYSPFYMTSVSIPALLTGAVLEKTNDISINEMMVTKADGSIEKLQTESTIFGDANARGIKTAIFGWSFPYARLFSKIDVVKDYPTTITTQISDHLLEVLPRQLRSLVETLYVSPFGNTLASDKHILSTLSMQRDVIKYFQSKQHDGLVFLHYPVPHSLSIYNRYTHKFGPNRNSDAYLDNLALTDLLLGDIRRTMEVAGTWDKNLVIVSSDHHWRANIYDGVVDKQRVPFIIKLPFQNMAKTVNSRFETVRTRDLIIQILDGKLKTAEDVALWIGSPPASD